MKFARWALLAVAVTLVIIAIVQSIHWLSFVAVGLILIAVALDPRRSHFGLRRS